jgi:hypothetical protein
MKGWQTVAMAVLALAMYSEAATANSIAWHVVENLSTRTCYRVTELPTGEDWRDLGSFNTFRQAGTFLWRNRSICQRSPIFN